MKNAKINPMTKITAKIFKENARLEGENSFYFEWFMTQKHNKQSNNDVL